MQIRELPTRPPQILSQLVTLWEASVRATHLFLSSEEIDQIKTYVPQALEQVAHLVIAEEGDTLLGFMGVENGRLEMLFLSPDARGKGQGKCLLQYGIQTYGVRQLTVNEQNPQAVGFYEHLGFTCYKRTPCDEQGGPYPLLYMKQQAL